MNVIEDLITLRERVEELETQESPFKRAGSMLSLASIVEPWHQIGAAGEPAFQNGWTHYGYGWPNAAFYKDPFGVVHMKGLIKSGTVGATAFTLPVGYRPTENRMITTFSNETVARIDIFYATGQVYVYSGSNVYISLDGASFRAA